MAYIRMCGGLKRSPVLRKMPTKLLPPFSLYNSCLRTISLLLIKRVRKSRQENPFQLMPSKILQDLVTTTLDLQNENGFTAASLELLLTSGNIRQFRIQSECLIHELVLALKYLTTACQNLEVLELTDLHTSTWIDAPTVLQELLKNSPNLKYIHSEIVFDLKALRNCKKLQTVMLHFTPAQPWCDFLEDENGRLQTLDSLEIFSVCPRTRAIDLLPPDDLITILQHCPSLVSLGMLNTSRVLAQLHRTYLLPQVKLRHCSWREWKSYNSDPEPEWIRDAMIYHPFVEELFIEVYCEENIASISSLRNLVYLDIKLHIRKDLSELFQNVFKDIGHQLKYLSLADCQMDISMALQNCGNLEALRIKLPVFKELAKPAVILRNLKYLDIFCYNNEAGQRLLSVFSDCNNIVKLSFGSFDDETLNKFLKRNSVSNLKAAFFVPCALTKRGFKKLFLNSPELEIIETPGSTFEEACELGENVKKALLETNHKALFRDYFFREKYCIGVYEEHFGFFDKFVFKKCFCY